MRELIVRVRQDENAYWAEVLDLPGCFASGDDLNELGEALAEAISLYLNDEPVLGEAGRPDRGSAPPRLQVGEMRVKVPA